MSIKIGKLNSVDAEASIESIRTFPSAAMLLPAACLPVEC